MANYDTEYTVQYILNRCFIEANNSLRTSWVGSIGVSERENHSASCNGTNTVFILAHNPVEKSVQVFLNGLLQEIGVDYTLVGTTITFALAPNAGDILIIHYIRS